TPVSTPAVNQIGTTRYFRIDCENLGLLICGEELRPPAAISLRIAKIGRSGRKGATGILVPPIPNPRQSIVLPLNTPGSGERLTMSHRAISGTLLPRE